MIIRSDMLLLGIGGGGCRLACSIVEQANVNFKALAVDTDSASSREAGESAIDFVLIGRDRLLGHGTGGDVAGGRVAADEDLSKLEPFLSDVRMAVVVTSLGSGTGGGATPKILGFLKERGITTLCFATLPFDFEGPTRMDCANAVMPMLQEGSDTLVGVSLGDLAAESGNDNMELAMEGAVKTLGAGVALIWQMVCSAGYIQLDPERLRSLVMSGKSARLGFAGSSEGIDRAGTILKRLSGYKLLCDSKGRTMQAEALMVGIIGGEDLLLSEISILMDGLKSMYQDDSRIEMGTVQDPLYNGRIEVVVFAFESRSAPVAVAPVSPLVSSDEPPVADILPVSKTAARKKAKISKLKVGPGGKFQNCDPTIYNGVDLDVPAYIRYGLNIEK